MTMSPALGNRPSATAPVHESARPRPKAGVISSEPFQGSHVHQATGAVYTYAGNCRVVVDLQGRESMHLRGSVFSGIEKNEFVALGLVDHAASFIGREHDAALGWIQSMCDRRSTAA
jgi:hypothetical protein